MTPPVVFVATSFRVHPRSGGEIRTNRLAAALARVTNLHLVVSGPADDGVAIRTSIGASSVDIFPWPSSPFVKRWIAVRNLWPLYFSWSWNPDARARVQVLAQQGAIVVLDHLQAWPYRPSGRPYLLSLHNIETHLLDQLSAPRGLRKLERRWESSTLRRAERAAIGDPDSTCIVVSEKDAARIACGIVVPNGTDLPPEVPARHEGGPLLFIGNMNHEPNRRAVEWWAREVFPARPGLLPLTVVGGGQAKLRHLQDDPAIDVIGEVDDVRPWLGKASLAVVPLLQGGGTRLKVLEAMAWGLPVVATSKAVEGLPLIDGLHVRIADEPDAFADAVLDLLADRGRRKLLAAEARRLAADYSWDRIGEAFVAHVLHVGEVER